MNIFSDISITQSAIYMVKIYVFKERLIPNNWEILKKCFVII